MEAPARAGAGNAVLTDSRLAALCAEQVQQAFLDYQERFHLITSRARTRFLERDWAGANEDALARLHLYGTVISDLTRRIEQMMGQRLRERSVWMAIKAVFSSLIAQSPEWEITETFFNSLTRQVFAIAGVDQAIEFVDTDFDAPPTEDSDAVSRRYAGGALPDLISQAINDPTAAGFAKELCAENLHLATGAAADRIIAQLQAEEPRLTSADESKSHAMSLEIVCTGFYRSRGAYLIGRVVWGEVSLPLALCLRHESAGGVTLDALLTGEDDLAILFSFTRASFQVDVQRPYGLVRYLRQLMPRKRLGDLYNAVGFHRHGKTEFYRDFVAHLRNSHDCFEPAEGARGMVMLVFTLPSYDVVFKLIKDDFDYPKDSNRREVVRRYRLVFEHDRAGRLVEAHEFEHLRIPQSRFDQALLDGLCRHTSGTVHLEGEDVIISHAYVERRVRPLNLHFAEADPVAGAAAARDYGQAIKDLAASNIFPGDLLPKNFGVTRHGRVVFYDYDELCFVTDCAFRELPVASSYEEEISAEPWYSVRENDIFPEEFPSFLGMPGALRETLVAYHGDLFQAEFWRGVQRQLSAGEIPEVLPYTSERRLAGLAEKH